jgi:site-specific DNA recombinase
MKAALYLRVSTDRQAKEGDSLEEQEAELKKFCEYRGFQIHHVFIEKGKSGGNTNRPLFLTGHSMEGL